MARLSANHQGYKSQTFYGKVSAWCMSARFYENQSYYPGLRNSVGGNRGDVRYSIQSSTRRLNLAASNALAPLAAFLRCIL
jgi:hypothetical protein